MEIYLVKGQKNFDIISLIIRFNFTENIQLYSNQYSPSKSAKSIDKLKFIKIKSHLCDGRTFCNIQ